MAGDYDGRKYLHKLCCMAAALCIAAAAGILAAGCGRGQSQHTRQTPVEDGAYTAEFHTDSSMFHVNEACEGRGMLTVENGTMTLHISLPSKNIVNLFPGLAEDAQKADAEILQPTIDTVTYSDGMTEEVHGFDIPVPVLDEEFDLALLGTKGKWYDHKVSVSGLEKKQELEDGEYAVRVTLEGGSGRAGIASPAVLLVKNGAASARIEWSSPNYDYMKIGSETYLPVNTDGNSVFEIPVAAFDEKMEVIADTTAMGTPHEITYALTFYADSIEQKPAVGQKSAVEQKSAVKTRSVSEASGIPAFTYSHQMKLDYAEGFAVDYYDGGYALITIAENSRRFLAVPEDKDIPKNLPEDITALKKPADNIYLAASAVMDMFAAMDAVENISLSGIKEDSWYVEEAEAAMKAGRLAYAGKYNMPDYERILDSGCRLAVESTMILHAPEVKETLEDLGIPVLIDRSSYEEHPLGRTEWVKLYGALTGKETEAEHIFNQQKKAFESVINHNNKNKNQNKNKTKQTAAFFYITSNGMASVRRAGDYIAKMIESAGGSYLFSDLKGDTDTASSSVLMQMEEFYAKAKDADYLIYNGAIDGGVDSLKDLLRKSPLFAECKAYQQGNVFCAARNLYQEPMEAGAFVLDLYRMLQGSEKNEDENKNKEKAFRYLSRLR